MAYEYERTVALPWSVGDTITSARLSNFNDELNRLFERLDDRSLTLSYNILGQLEQIVDGINTITVNIDWSMFNDLTTPKLFIQELGSPDRFTVEYSLSGYPTTVTYGP